MNAIYSALVKAQAQMRAAELDKTNPHYKSKYASLASVWDAIRKPLTDAGLAITQTFSHSDGVLLMVTRLVHTSGESIESVYPINPSRADAQGMGSAITYARRYAISAMVGLTADDDDDGNTVSNVERYERVSKEVKKPVETIEPVKPAAAAKAQPKEADKRKEIVSRIKAVIDSGKWTKDQVSDYCFQSFSTKDSAKLSQDQLILLASVLENSTFDTAIFEADVPL